MNANLFNEIVTVINRAVLREHYGKSDYTDMKEEILRCATKIYLEEVRGIEDEETND